MKKKFIILFSAFIILLAALILDITLTHKETRGKWVSTKGGEVGDVSQWYKYQQLIGDLNLAWARIPVDWSQIEIADGNYDWSSTEYVMLKNAVASAKGMGAEVILTIRDAPEFLIDQTYGQSPYGSATPWPDLCGRITPYGTIHLANFVTVLLEELKFDFKAAQDSPPPVTYIELWNEPDVDPTQTVRPDLYGCWRRAVQGDSGILTPTGTRPAYEAGSYYAEVLNFVAPAVKLEFPGVKFIAGAAASASSGFLDGIIDHALNNIDVVSYHQYVKASNKACDISSFISTQENSFNYVRNYLDTHGGPSKPILISEGAMGYSTFNNTPVPQGTQTPAPSFYDCQAKFASNQLNWTQEKAANGKLLGFIWYTVGTNGWEETDLLFPNKALKPVYFDWKN